MNAKALKRFFAVLPETGGTLSSTSSLPMAVLLEDAVTVHHLRNVVRAKPGEQVVLVDGEREVAYEAVILEIEKTAIRISLESKLPAPEAGTAPVTLAIALLKEHRWDLMLQKATELGARAIQPILAERCVVRLDGKDAEKKRERWQAVVRAAAEQSEGMFIPRVPAPMTLAEFCSQNPDGIRVLLMERGGDRRPMKQALAGLTAARNRPVILAIGPEGGWTDEEAERFRRSGFEACSLGARILRSETAAIAALSAVIYESEP